MKSKKNASNEIPGQDGVIFQGVFDSPPENAKFFTGFEPGDLDESIKETRFCS